MKISHVWRGHGTALFLELGSLSEGRKRKDGTTGNAKGDVTVIVDFDWRIERQRSILCGSGETKRRIASASKLLLGASVLSSEVVGRIPELQLQLSNGLWLITFRRYEGQPSWAVGFNTLGLGWLGVKGGRLNVDTRKLFN